MGQRIRPHTREDIAKYKMSFLAALVESEYKPYILGEASLISQGPIGRRDLNLRIQLPFIADKDHLRFIERRSKTSAIEKELNVLQWGGFNWQTGGRIEYSDQGLDHAIKTYINMERARTLVRRIIEDLEFTWATREIYEKANRTQHEATPKSRKSHAVTLGIIPKESPLRQALFRQAREHDFFYPIVSIPGYISVKGKIDLRDPKNGPPLKMGVMGLGDASSSWGC